jgi:hypothetical protein
MGKRIIVAVNEIAALAASFPIAGHCGGPRVPYAEQSGTDNEQNATTELASGEHGEPDIGMAGVFFVSPGAGVAIMTEEWVCPLQMLKRSACSVGKP